MKSMFAKVAHPNIAVGKSKNYFTHLEFLTVLDVLRSLPDWSEKNRFFSLRLVWPPLICKVLCSKIATVSALKFIKSRPIIQSIRKMVKI